MITDSDIETINEELREEIVILEAKSDDEELHSNEAGASFLNGEIKAKKDIIERLDKLTC